MIPYKIGDTGPSGGIVFMLSEDKMHGVEAQREDHPKYMDWDDAFHQFKRKGWRLPTKDELNVLYLLKDLILGFDSCMDSSYYWSSSEHDNGSAYLQSFVTGNSFVCHKNETFAIRVVKEF